MPITNAPRSYQRIKNRRAIQQLLDTDGAARTLHQVVAEGAAAETGIEVSGIAVGDEFVSVLYFSVAEGAVADVADVTSEATITDTDEIQLDTTVTTGGILVVTFWH